MQLETANEIARRHGLPIKESAAADAQDAAHTEPRWAGRRTAGTRAGAIPPRQVQPLVEPLSERELEVLRLIADGLSNQEVAEKLIIATGTVKAHVNHIYDKLDVRSRTRAIARARELELL